MPQLFPMSWIILSLLFSMCMLISLIHIFYFPMKSNKFFMLPMFPKTPLYKW
uniref:ATPase 8 n=1 Tax=Ixodes hexagonus TaxID=34612 RepID=O99808_IXOHE|nr:ATP synthase F0 subunit 8 [Ixodes hexagonus]AAD05507.1 ATPase 8 [Ixodes hexagonus]